MQPIFTGRLNSRARLSSREERFCTMLSKTRLSIKLTVPGFRQASRQTADTQMKQREEAIMQRFFINLLLSFLSVVFTDMGTKEYRPTILQTYAFVLEYYKYSVRNINYIFVFG